MTRLVHIGDFHAHPGPRNADRYRALDQIIAEQLARPAGIGAWLWPGDLFHARSTVEDRNAIDERLQRMATVAPVLLVYGNHDGPGELDGFARLHGRFPIIVVDRPQTIGFKLATGELAAAFCLPYPTKAGLTSAGVAHGDLIPTAAEALDAIFMKAAAELDDARVLGALCFMIGHVNVAGSLMSAGQPNIGHEIEIGPQHLDRLGSIYKGLNHIHKAQAIAGAHYPGSVCRLNWGEIEEKGYIVVHVEHTSNALRPHDWTYGWSFMPIDVAPMFHVTGMLTRDGFFMDQDAPLCPDCGGTGNDSDSGMELPSSCDLCGGDGRRHVWAGAEVRCRYRYEQSEKSALDEARVRAQFADAARLEIEPIAVPDRELRAPAVAAARTLADKLAAYSQVDSLAPSVASKLALLEHADPLTILTTVQNELVRLEAGEKETVAA